MEGLHDRDVEVAGRGQRREAAQPVVGVDDVRPVLGQARASRSANSGMCGISSWSDIGRASPADRCSTDTRGASLTRSPGTQPVPVRVDRHAVALSGRAHVRVRRRGAVSNGGGVEGWRTATMAMFIRQTPGGGEIRGVRVGEAASRRPQNGE